MGAVTTCAEVSACVCAVRTRHQPVRSLLCGAAKEHAALTHRAVNANGELAALPAASERQSKQLIAEGVPFAPDGPVKLKLALEVVLE